VWVLKYFFFPAIIFCRFLYSYFSSFPHHLSFSYSFPKSVNIPSFFSFFPLLPSLIVTFYLHSRHFPTFGHEERVQLNFLMQTNDKPFATTTIRWCQHSRKKIMQIRNGNVKKKFSIGTLNVLRYFSKNMEFNKDWIWSDEKGNKVTTILTLFWFDPLPLIYKRSYQSNSFNRVQKRQIIYSNSDQLIITFKSVLIINLT